MSGDRIDPETIAGLLDGSLSAEERSRALAMIAADGQSYRDFVEAAALRSELEEDAPGADAAAALGAPPATPTLLARRSAFMRPRTYMLAALATAAAITLMVVTRRDTPGSQATVASALALTTLVSGHTNFQATVGGDWQPAPWSATRGEAAVIDPSGAAFRVGAYVADLNLAMMLNDSTAADGFARRLTSFAAEAPGGAPIVARLRQIATSVGSTSEAREVLAQELRSASGAPDWFDVGVLLESARLLRHRNTIEPGGEGLVADAVARLVRLTSTDGERIRMVEELRQLSNVTPIRARALLDTAVVFFAR